MTLRWNKICKGRKQAGMRLSFRVNDLPGIPRYAAGESPEALLQHAANVVYSWIGSSGCDFVEPPSYREYRSGYRSLQNAIQVSQPVQICHMLPAANASNETHARDIESLMTTSVLVRLDTKTLLCKGKRRSDFAIAHRGGHVAARNAATTIAYWLAACLGTRALAAVMPHRRPVPVLQQLMTGFVPTDYNDTADTESDHGPGPNKRRRTRRASESEAAAPHTPQATWILPCNEISSER